VVRAARQALAADCFARVVVVAEDDAIVVACRRWKIEALKTPPFPTGTDRVAWAAQVLGSEWVVNLQGDEPLFPPQTLRDVATCLPEDSEALWTCAQAAPLTAAELADPDVVKICLEHPGSPVSLATDFHRALPQALESCARVHVGLYAGCGSSGACNAGRSSLAAAKLPLDQLLPCFLLWFSLSLPVH